MGASEMPGPSLIVGVDFGTTCSGSAYVDTDINLRSRIKPVYFNHSDVPKVPTKLCYCVRGSHQGTDNASHFDNYQYSWGLQVSEYCPEPREFFKLLLDPERTNESFNEDIPTSVIGSNRRLPGRGAASTVSVVEMVKHFLSAMRKEFYAQLQRDYRQLYRDEDFNIDWIFTVPAFFSPEMVGRLKQEIIPQAGFVGTICTLLEPQGAATNVLLDALTSQTHAPRANEKILVCDAGGGTTDLFAFEVQSLEQSHTGPKLKMKPLGEFCGGLIGAMDINEAFEGFLQRAWKPIQESSKDPRDVLEGYRQRDFLNAHRKFDEYKTSFNEENIPRPIEFSETVGVATIEKAGIDCGVLDISTKQMKKFFDDVILQVFRVIQGYIETLRRSGHVLQTMIFVGGLAASPYVRQKMEDWTRAKEMTLITPPDKYQIIAAVMRGAVQHRLHEKTQSAAPTSAIVQRSSFGYVLDEQYDPAKHRDEPGNHIIDECTGRRMATKQIRWLVKKGETTFPNEHGELVAQTIHHERFVKGQSRKWTYTVVRTEMEDIANLPSTIDHHVTHFADVSINLNSYRRKDLDCFKQYWRQLPPVTGESRWIKRLRGGIRVKYYETEINLALQFEHGGEVKPIVQTALEASGCQPKRKNTFIQWMIGKAYR